MAASPITITAPLVYCHPKKTVIDERIAEARLADARAERDRITALANGGDVLGAVAATLPETQRKAYERSLRPMPAVRALKAANGDEGDGG